MSVSYLNKFACFRSRQHENVNTDKTQQRVWVLQDGQPVVFPIAEGDTDGVYTEVLKGEIEPGMAVIVDTVSAEK